MDWLRHFIMMIVFGLIASGPVVFSIINGIKSEILLIIFLFSILVYVVGLIFYYFIETE
jgi:hypothetical protein